MAAVSIYENLGEEFRCIICKEILRNPKNLSCGHTFCQEPCLSSLIQKSQGNKITCPSCMKATVIPPSRKAGDLPDNHILKGVLDKLKNAPKVAKCPTHQSPLTFFCLKCQKTVCAGCLVSAHDNKNGNIKQLSEVVTEKRKFYEKMDVQLRKALDLQKNLTENYRRRKDILKAEAKALEAQIKQSANESVAFIRSNEQTMLINVNQVLENQLKTISNSDRLVGTMRAKLKSSIETNQVLLRDLSNNEIPSQSVESAFQRKVREVDHAHVSPDKMSLTLGLYHLNLPCSFQFADVKGCKVVGVVWLTPVQIIWIIDQREEGAGINVWCVDPREPSKKFWSHKFDPVDQTNPIILCPISYRFRKFNHVLLACGKELFVLYFKWSGEIYDAVEHVSKRTLQLPNDAVISAINCHDELSKRSTEFLVATTKTSHLLRFSHKYELLGTIDCSGAVSACASFACVDTKIAVIDQVNDDVRLLRHEEQNATLICKLAPPNGCIEPLPVSVIWDGGGFVVLWKATDTGNSDSFKWLVAVYKRSGEFLRICGEGTCLTYGVPVGFTRCMKEVAVCFGCEVLKIYDINSGVTPV